MAVGRAAFQSANDINSTVGGLASELENLMGRITRTNKFIQATDLASTFGMSDGDSDIIKSAMADMDLLRQVHDGAVNLTVSKNFQANILELVGIPNS